MGSLINWEFIPLVPPQTIDDLPKSDDPYYVATKDGIFIRKTTLLGDCLLPQRTMPEYLASVGTSKAGTFWFKAPKIPARVMSQAASFFKKVFDTKHTESEVLLLYNDEIENESQRFKLLIPTQLTSYANVKSIYEASEVEGNWQLIGSIHCHCDFEAFHSSTDTEDASDFMGVHITIGNIDTTPSFAAMVTVSGVQFHYDIEIVANVENIRTDLKVPNAWLNLTATNADDISNLDISKFKSISKDFMEEWLGLKKKKFTSVPKTTPKTITSLIPAKKSAFNKDLIWSYEMQGYVPKHYLKNGRILDEFYLDALEDTLANLREEALKRNVLVVYDLDFLPEKENKGIDWKEYAAYVPTEGEMLPGPFPVAEDDDTEAAIKAYMDNWGKYNDE